MTYRCIAIALLLLSACGGSSYQSNVYRDGEARYALAGPRAPWAQVDVAGQNDLAWHNPQTGAVIQANASCDPALDIPLRALTAHLLIGFTERELVEEEVVPFSEREALRTHVRAKLDGVPRELLLTVLKKDNCVYDFALVAPPAAYAAAEGDYDAMLESFDPR